MIRLHVIAQLETGADTHIYALDSLVLQAQVAAAIEVKIEALESILIFIEHPRVDQPAVVQGPGGGVAHDPGDFVPLLSLVSQAPAAPTMPVQSNKLHRASCAESDERAALNQNSTINNHERQSTLHKHNQQSTIIDN